MIKEDFEKLKRKKYSECCNVKGYYDNPMMVTFEEGMKFMKDTLIDLMEESVDIEALEEKILGLKI